MPCSSAGSWMIRVCATPFACLLLALGACLLLPLGAARAGFLDDDQNLDQAFAQLRAAIGEHARVLKIDVAPRAVTIAAQEPANHRHVDEWQCDLISLGPLVRRKLKGPQPIEPQLLDPDIDSGIFDLGSIDLSAAPRLEREAIAYAHLEDEAHVTRIEIARQMHLLPDAEAGEVSWRLHVASAREHADVYADTHGTIVGSDLSGTLRAKTFDLFTEPRLAQQAAEAFRAKFGAQRILTAVEVTRKTIGFRTNIVDAGTNRLFPGVPARALYVWDLDGLQQRPGTFDAAAPAERRSVAPFSVDDVNWGALAAAVAAALAKTGPEGHIARLTFAASAAQPGEPKFAWTVDLAEDETK